jgi:hypothetical protein
LKETVAYTRYVCVGVLGAVVASQMEHISEHHARNSDRYHAREFELDSVGTGMFVRKEMTFQQ